jgi:hypothetical protein
LRTRRPESGQSRGYRNPRFPQFQFSVGNPLLLVASAFALTLVAAIACLIPARRAAVVQPIIAIRCD